MSVVENYNLFTYSFSRCAVHSLGVPLIWNESKFCLDPFFFSTSADVLCKIVICADDTAINPPCDTPRDLL